MDFRFLLALLLPALVTAGTYSYDRVPPLGPDMGNQLDMENFGGSDEKMEGDDMNMSGAASAAVMNEGSSYANAAIEEFDMKAKTVEQSARWYRNLLSEKQIILAQVKKRYNLLRSIAMESLQSAEQYRRSCAEKSQTSKALEMKAREAQTLSKEQAVQVNELRTKLNSELKQHLNCLINSRVAEANAEIDMVEVDRHKSWGTYLEKQAQDMISEAAKWERRSVESLEVAKKLKMEASAESAKGNEFEKKRKEAEDAANEAEKKARNFYFFNMEFNCKSQGEELQVALAKIKGKYYRTIAASLAESGSYLEMFSNLQYKDATLWEKKTATVRGEAKLLEASVSKMAQSIEKLKATIKTSHKDKELVVQERKVIKAEPKVVDAPVIITDKKL